MPLLPLTIEEARAWYDDDPTHGFGHILRVLRLAEFLAREASADTEVVRAAALLPRRAVTSAPP